MEESFGPDPEFLVLVPVLNLLGLLLKRSPVRDERIPLLLGAAGVALACLGGLGRLEAFGLPAVVACLYRGVTQGLLAAGSSVYLHQLVHQGQKAVPPPPTLRPGQK